MDDDDGFSSFARVEERVARRNLMAVNARLSDDTVTLYTIDTHPPLKLYSLEKLTLSFQPMQQEAERGSNDMLYDQRSGI